MAQDTPDADRVARVIAENVYAAFCRRATMPAHPLEEQTILARLVEAIRPQIGRARRARSSRPPTRPCRRGSSGIPISAGRALSR